MFSFSFQILRSLGFLESSLIKLLSKILDRIISLRPSWLPSIQYDIFRQIIELFEDSLKQFGHSMFNQKYSSQNLHDIESGQDSLILVQLVCNCIKLNPLNQRAALYFLLSFSQLVSSLSVTTMEFHQKCVKLDLLLELHLQHLEISLSSRISSIHGLLVNCVIPDLKKFPQYIQKLSNGLNFSFQDKHSFSSPRLKLKRVEPIHSYDSRAYWDYLSPSHRPLYSYRGLLPFVGRLFKFIRQIQVELSANFINTCVKPLHNQLTYLKNSLSNLTGERSDQIKLTLFQTLLNIPEFDQILKDQYPLNQGKFQNEIRVFDTFRNVIQYQLQNQELGKHMLEAINSALESEHSLDTKNKNHQEEILGMVELIQRVKEICQSQLSIPQIMQITQSLVLERKLSFPLKRGVDQFRAALQDNFLKSKDWRELTTTTSLQRRNQFFITETQVQMLRVDSIEIQLQRQPVSNQFYSTSVPKMKQILSELNALNFGSDSQLKNLAQLWLIELSRRLGHDQAASASAFTFIKLMLRKLTSAYHIEVLTLLNFSFEHFDSLDSPVQKGKIQRAIIEADIFSLLIDIIGKAKSEREVTLSIRLVRHLLEKPNIKSQRKLLECIKKSREEFLITISKILRNGDIAKRESIKKIIECLKMLQLMCQNCFSPMQSYLLQTGGGEQGLRNLLYQVGYLFIRASFKELHQRTYTLLPEIVETLINFSFGSVEELRQFFTSWKTFIRQVQKVILLSYASFRIAYDLKIQMTFVRTSEFLLSIAHRNSRRYKDITLLQTLDTQKIQSLLTDIYFDSIRLSNNSEFIKGGFYLFNLLVGQKPTSLGSTKLKYFGISLPPDQLFMTYLTQPNESIPITELVAKYSEQAQQELNHHPSLKYKSQPSQYGVSFLERQIRKRKSNTADHNLQKRTGMLAFPRKKVNLKRRCSFCCQKKSFYYIEYQKISKQNKISTQRELFLAAFLYFSSQTGSLQIQFRGTLQRVIFRIPDYCWFLSKQTRLSLIKNLGLLSQSQKHNLLLKKLKELRVDMLHQQKLKTNYKCFYFLSSWFNLWDSFNFLVILLINLILLFELQEPEEVNRLNTQPSFSIITTLKVIQLLVSLFIFSIYLISFYPVMMVKYRRKQKDNKLQKKLFPKTQGSTVQSLVEESQTSLSKSKKKSNCFLLLKDRIVIWKLIICILSIGGLFGIQYFFYPFMLLDLIPRLRTLFNIVKAIQGNARTFIYTLLLLLIIIYIYSILGFTFFRQDFMGDELQGPFHVYCGNLFECFTSTLNAGLRAGGGVAQSLNQEKLSSPDYWKRYIFDLSFFFIVIILMLNIIFGVVLDAFAELRDNDKARTEDIEGVV